MKKTLLLLASAIVISCSTESNDEGENNNSTDGNKLVKREYVSDNFNLEYRYNENDLLTRVIVVLLEEEIDIVETFKYDQNNNVIEEHLESNNSNYKSITYYEYDNSNRLTKAIKEISRNNAITIIQTFSYSGNLITAIRNSGGESSTIILEISNSGLIKKINENYGSSVFEYDNNNNITSITTFDKEDNLLHSHNYTYDNNPNPFYGQLESLYIPIFLTEMEDLYFGEAVTMPFSGYNFPFLKNNMTSFGLRGFYYTYNENNLPTNVVEKWNDTNEVSFQFDIEYFE